MSANQQAIDLKLDKQYILEFDAPFFPNSPTETKIRLIGRFNRVTKKDTATFYVWNESTRSYAVVSVNFKQIVGEY